ncbi:hypothetical protein R4282_05975 [Rhodococcus oxybenzonivorans]|jgi:hypothetical protein|uniref:hypothetical protein n=2 Tax=Nocardiaceae TaxID=85025 RepID=UPI001F25DB3C|nr:MULTISPECIES: hypothetical protein [Rhodococcus]MDV7352567.1 hypothetical protein [Rhodococcus oxybenzonivorans]
MTTTTSPSPSSDRRRGHLPWLMTSTRPLGAYCSDVSVMLGALSIVMFWMFGFGILLGAGAIATGIVASRNPSVEADESTSLEALIGILTGAFGIAVGIVFLAAALPHM